MLITSVAKKSPAHRAGLRAGETLAAINGHPIRDVLDYGFYSYEERLDVTVRGEDGVLRRAVLYHEEGSDLGLAFETFLMDKERTCSNKCVFCFIDQLPRGMRESLYVKDDDARLSFLLGNYITLTNLSRDDVERIITMKLSPLGVSVHTTNPELRVKMLRNKNAGDCLGLLRRLTDASISINGQIVLCPGYNDGQELRRTLDDLAPLSLNSLSVVPVGLTSHREGLAPIDPVSPELALETIKLCSGYKRVFCADELYILSGVPLPGVEHYGEFPQLENGVGMMALFIDEFHSCGPLPEVPRQTAATGRAAYPYIGNLLSGSNARAVCVESSFFGDRITVSGLLTGRDYLAALNGLELGKRVLIPANSLRRGEEVFLDDMTVSELSGLLNTEVTPVDTDGGAFWDALTR